MKKLIIFSWSMVIICFVWMCFLSVKFQSIFAWSWQMEFLKIFLTWSLVSAYSFTWASVSGILDKEPK